MQFKWFSAFLCVITLSSIFIVSLSSQAAAVSAVRGKFVLAFDLPKVKRKYMPVLPPGGPGGFCQAFTNNLNQFRQLTFDTCSPRLSPKYPRFSRPKWHEIPLDMALAKKVIEIHHGWWQGWLKAAKAERAAGKVKMWRLHADILSDSHSVTLIRLDHAVTGYPKTSCQDYDSDQMLIDASDPKTKTVYERPLSILISTLGNDLIYDSKSKRYYILEWSISGAAHAESEDAYIPDYDGGRAIFTKGAKASVMVYLPLPRGPWPTCWINWVPVHNVKK